MKKLFFLFSLFALSFSLCHAQTGRRSVIHIENGGTSDSTARGALHNLLPDTTGNTLKYLRGDYTWQTVSGGGLTNWIDSINNLDAATPLISFVAKNDAAFISIAIQPKGRGFFSLNIPDSTWRGGNERGPYAVDLQLDRSDDNRPSEVASGSHSAIIGGSENTAAGDRSIILAGRNNQAYNHNNVVGGSSNKAYGATSVVFGASNKVQPNVSTIAGGANNLIDTSGGDGNTGGGSFIGGGTNNYTNNNNTVVVGGSGNSVLGEFSFIGGGESNIVGDTSSVDPEPTNHSFIGGGYNNRAEATYGMVLGGAYNIVASQYTSIIGGSRLTLSGTYSLGSNSEGDDVFVTCPMQNVALFNGADIIISTAIHHPRSLIFIGINDSTNIDTASIPYVGIRAPDTVNQSRNYTLPASDGANGTVLATDGNGKMSWHPVVSPSLGPSTTPAAGVAYQDNQIIAWGNIAADGTINAQFGNFTIVHTGTGVFTITLPTTPSAACGTMSINGSIVGRTCAISISGATVTCSTGISSVLNDQSFYFIITGRP